MRKFLFFFMLTFVVMSKAQLSGDAFIFSSECPLGGKTILKEELRNYKRMRQREKFIGKRYPGKCAQRFIRKKHAKNPKKRKERFLVFK